MRKQLLPWRTHAIPPRNRAKESVIGRTYPERYDIPIDPSPQEDDHGHTGCFMKLVAGVALASGRRVPLLRIRVVGVMRSVQAIHAGFSGWCYFARGYASPGRPFSIVEQAIPDRFRKRSIAHIGNASVALVDFGPRFDRGACARQHSNRPAARSRLPSANRLTCRQSCG